MKNIKYVNNVLTESKENPAVSCNLYIGDNHMCARTNGKIKLRYVLFRRS